jgi:hypothetical protein
MERSIILQKSFRHICDSNLMSVQRTVHWEHVWVTVLNGINTKNCLFHSTGCALHTPSAMFQAEEQQLGWYYFQNPNITKRTFIICVYQDLGIPSSCDQTLQFSYGGIHALFDKKSGIILQFLILKRTNISYFCASEGGASFVRSLVQSSESPPPSSSQLGQSLHPSSLLSRITLKQKGLGYGLNW